MDQEEQIGRRLGELRKQQGHRQEDFLELLSARGVNWTQATLSRVEGGKRPIRLTEAFAIAETLDIDPRDLSPERSGIGYRVEALKIQFNRLQQNATEAISRRNTMRNGIAALILADALSRDRNATYAVQGTGNEFVKLVGKWCNPPGDSGRWRAWGLDYTEVLEILGFERTYFEPTPDQKEDYIRHFDAWIVEKLSSRFPNLTFSEDYTNRFSVPGLTDFLDTPGPLPPMGVDGLRVTLGIGPSGG